MFFWRKVKQSIDTNTNVVIFNLNWNTVYVGYDIKIPEISLGL